MGTCVVLLCTGLIWLKTGMFWVVVNWTDLAQNRYICWAVVNLVMKLWVPGADNFLLAEELSASHGLCSMKLVCELIHLKQTLKS